LVKKFGDCFDTIPTLNGKTGRHTIRYMNIARNKPFSRNNILIIVRNDHRLSADGHRGLWIPYQP